MHIQDMYICQTLGDNIMYQYLQCYKHMHIASYNVVLTKLQLCIIYVASYIRSYVATHNKQMHVCPLNFSSYVVRSPLLVISMLSVKGQQTLCVKWLPMMLILHVYYCSTLLILLFALKCVEIKWPQQQMLVKVL